MGMGLTARVVQPCPLLTMPSRTARPGGLIHQNADGMTKMARLLTNGKGGTSMAYRMPTSFCWLAGTPIMAHPWEEFVLTT